VRLRLTSKKEEVELRNGSQSDMWRLSDGVTVTPRVSGVHKKNCHATNFTKSVGGRGVIEQDDDCGEPQNLTTRCKYGLFFFF
jgi:hypothetical protein